MFYQADDIMPAFQTAEGLLGKNGRMDSTAVHKNVAVATAAFGKIWYGDLDSFNEVHTLANVLGVNCMVIPSTGYSLPRYIAEPKLTT